MPKRGARILVILLLLSSSALPLLLPETGGWGNGDPSSPEWSNFGVHDITNDIALRTATYLAGEEVAWVNDWYLRNETDRGYSFDPASTGPTETDNFNAYTDDPDTHWKDWENHTYFVHPRPWWPPAEGDATRRVHHLYNLTRDHVYAWLMNGSVRFDADEHRAAYYAGIMSHYVMDVTQFGHTDWTRQDHSHPADDPQDATYHGYYEARSWTDEALRHLHVDLMSNYVLPEFDRVADPGQLVRDMAAWVNGRHGPDVQFTDLDSSTVTLGSTYVRMLTAFRDNYDADVGHNGARGYDGELWNLTLENLFAGMTNLTNLWVSAYLDAHDMFLEDAADIEVLDLWARPAEGAYEGQEVVVKADVKNNGSTDVDEFNLTFLVDDEVVADIPVELLAGEGIGIGVKWLAVAGEHELRVVADPMRRVPESNESNNELAITYNVTAEFHATNLTAEPWVLEVLQDDVGTFELTLSNLGNRPDTFDVTIETGGGGLDLAVTLLEDELALAAGGNATFEVNVSTRLDSTLGRRGFDVVARGGNSTSRAPLAVVVLERQVAPFIEVDHPFYTNVSVPVTFDASGSWDHNGDPITFTWDFGDNTTGGGAVVEHAYGEEGIYLIRLNASDGELHRIFTLEVSVLDAIPPLPWLTLLESDLGVVRLGWTPWNSNYFNAYYLYASEGPDGTVSEENLVKVIDGLRYVSNTTVTLLDGRDHVAMVTENIFGLRVASEPIEVRARVRTVEYPPDHPLHSQTTLVRNETKYSVVFEWAEWDPIGLVDGYVVTIREHWGEPPLSSARIEDLSVTSHEFTGLEPGGSYVVTVNYTREHTFSMTSRSAWTAVNVPPFVGVSPLTNAGQGDACVLDLEYTDSDGNVTTVQVWWGDGTEPEVRYVLFDTAPLEHVYDEPGEYEVTILVGDDDGNYTHAGTTVVVVERREGVGATTVLALVVLVAVVAVLAYVTYWRQRAPPAGKG